MFLVSSCPIHWSQMLSQEWRCSWSRQATLQLHLSDQQLYCLLRCLILEVWGYSYLCPLFRGSLTKLPLKLSLQAIACHTKLWDEISYPCAHLTYNLMITKVSRNSGQQLRVWFTLFYFLRGADITSFVIVYVATCWFFSMLCVNIGHIALWPLLLT